MRLVSLLAVCAACSGGDDPPTTDNTDPVVYPLMAFSGFDGADPFRVPLVTNLTGSVTWTVEDPSIADVASAPAPAMSPIPDGAWAVATMKRAGSTRIIATAGAERSESMLVVSTYDAAAVAAGRARYQATIDPTGPARGCASCHAQPTGADHSPTLMAYYDDAAILSVVTTGMYPDGRKVDVAGHMWTLTATERAGIVPYLRSLPPRGF